MINDDIRDFFGHIVIGFSFFHMLSNLIIIECSQQPDRLCCRHSIYMTASSFPIRHISIVCLHNNIREQRYPPYFMPILAIYIDLKIFLNRASALLFRPISVSITQSNLFSIPSLIRSSQDHSCITKQITG